MSVKIGFSTNPTNLLSKVIRFFSNSPVSHAFFIADWDGTEVMVEAHWNGLRVLDFKQWKRDKPTQLVAVIEPRVSLQKGFDSIIPYLGQPYDFGGLFGMAFVMVGRWLKKKWANPWNSNKALFCSEIVAQVLTWERYPGWTSLPADDITPDDLFDFFKNEATIPTK